MNKIIFCNQMPEDKSDYSVLLHGNHIPDSATLLIYMWKLLGFPEPLKEYNWDAYLDWMRDLEWIPYKNISITIINYNNFLKNEPQFKEVFISDFENVIFPFWKKDAIKVFQTRKKVKNITIYCVQEK